MLQYPQLCYKIEWWMEAQPLKQKNARSKPGKGEGICVRIESIRELVERASIRQRLGMGPQVVTVFGYCLDSGIRDPALFRPQVHIPVCNDGTEERRSGQVIRGDTATMNVIVHRDTLTLDRNQNDELVPDQLRLPHAAIVTLDHAAGLTEDEGFQIKALHGGQSELRQELVHGLDLFGWNGSIL